MLKLANNLKNNDITVWSYRSKDISQLVALMPKFGRKIFFSELRFILKNPSWIRFWHHHSLKTYFELYDQSVIPHCHLINPLTISHYLCHVFIAFVKMNSHISDRFCNPSSEKMYGDKNVCSAGMDFANVICYITLDAIK